MKSRTTVLWVVLGLLALATAGIAATVTVQPVPASKIGDLNLQLEASAMEVHKLPSTLTASAIGAGADVPVASHLEQLAATFERTLHRRFVTDPLHEYDFGSVISRTRGGRSLDMPLCSIRTAPDTSLTLFQGIEPGDAYKVWMDPSTCAGCVPAFPYRVDSVRFLLIQQGGSIADTVFLGIDIECARLDPTDPCNGPGAERCFEIISIALPADTNSVANIFTVTIPMDSCWVDGPFFLGLWHLGHTATAFYHPTYLMDNANVPPVVNCTAWADLGLGWASWANTWVDPDPGYPIATLFGECNAPNAPAITPCPEECGHQRISAGLAYYSTGVVGNWTWFDLNATELPYRPSGIEFSLYWWAPGALGDSVQLLVTYGCPNNGNLCCAPSDVLCAGTATIVQTGSGLQPVSLDLSTLNCCIQEDFWVGVQIVRFVGDTLPSFLWSNRTAEPPIPPCEQWQLTTTQQPWPQGSLGWQDVLITGECDAPCAGQTCAVSTLNCAGAMQINCSDAGPQVFTNQTNVGGGTTASMYCCQNWNESGPERVYAVTVPAGGSIRATLSSILPAGTDLDVFILSSCNPGSCLRGGDLTAYADALAGGTYYVVVDGFNGAAGTYTLTVDVPCSPPAICLTQTQCGTGLNGGGTILVWDGELLPNGHRAFLCQGTTAGGGNDMVVKIIDQNCALVSTIDIGGNSLTQVARGLAYDPRDGSWWTGTFVAPNVLRRYNAAGTLIATFDSVYFGGTWTVTAVSGLAFDTDNNHLWANHSSRQAGRYTEFNLANPAAPAVLQAGAMPIYTTGNSHSGLDYDECSDRLIAANFRGSPLGIGDVECWQDNNPAGIGGVTLVSACRLPAGGVTQNWGISLSATDRQICLPNLDVAANTNHTVWTSNTSCSYTLPIAQAVTTYLVSGQLEVRWTAPQAGRYRIYASTVRNNDGNPNGGADPDFTLATTVTVGAGPQVWTDVSPVGVYKNYVVTQVCP